MSLASPSPKRFCTSFCTMAFFRVSWTSGSFWYPSFCGGVGQDLELHEAVEELLLPVEVLVALAEEGGLLVEARLELGDGDDDAFALGDGGAALLGAGGGGLAATGKGENDRETGRDECTRHRGEAPVFVG